MLVLTAPWYERSRYIKSKAKNCYVELGFCIKHISLRYTCFRAFWPISHSGSFPVVFKVLCMSVVGDGCCMFPSSFLSGADEKWAPFGHISIKWWPCLHQWSSWWLLYHKDINLSVDIPVLVGYIFGFNQFYKLWFYWTQRSLLPCTLRFPSTPRWCFNSRVLHDQIIYENVNVPDDWLPGVALRWVHTTWEKTVTATGQDCWGMMQSKRVKFCL